MQRGPLKRLRAGVAVVGGTSAVVVRLLAEPEPGVAPAQPRPQLERLELEAPVRSRRLRRVEHVAAPGDTPARVAARYGVDDARLCDLNGSLCRGLAPGDRLVIYTDAQVLPLQMLVHRVAPDEVSWPALARRLGVPEQRLRRGDPAARPRSKSMVRMWVPSGVHPREDIAGGWRVEVNADAESVGAPDAGTLTMEVQLPASSLYTRREPRLMYGGAVALAQLPTAVARFRLQYGYTGELVIGDLSRRGGGPLPPHLSHQSGRDVDVWLPLLRGARAERPPRPRPSAPEVDWPAAWGLVESLVATDAVEVIFLACELQPRLHAAGRMMGASELMLREVIQWRPDAPDEFCAGPRPNRGVVRHAKGHVGHIHVRFRCGPQETRCHGLRREHSDEAEAGISGE